MRKRLETHSKEWTRRSACKRRFEHSFRLSSRLATVHINETAASRARDELRKLCARARFCHLPGARHGTIPRPAERPDAAPLQSRTGGYGEFRRGRGARAAARRVAALSGRAPLRARATRESTREVRLRQLGAKPPWMRAREACGVRERSRAISPDYRKARPRAPLISRSKRPTMIAKGIHGRLGLRARRLCTRERLGLRLWKWECILL